MRQGAIRSVRSLADGRPSGKTDALLVTVRDFTPGEAEITLAILYRPAYDAEGFAVHRPKFLDFQGTELAEARRGSVARHLPA